MKNIFTNIYNFFKPGLTNILRLVRQIILAVIVGAAAGGVGILFYHGMNLVTGARLAHPALLYFLPLGGLLIVFLYRISGQYDNKGTNLMLLGVQSNEKISIKVAPLIFVSTLITHLFGGSAGREGAALQIGGSVGDFLGRLKIFKGTDEHIFIMCGMSACFSAVFGTPLAAAVFSMEVISVGIIHYSALVPCVISSFTASALARRFGALPEFYQISSIPDFYELAHGLPQHFPALRVLLLAVIFAAVSALFCICLHLSEHLYKKYFKNPYLRIFVGGCLIILLVTIFQTRDFIGTGVPMIKECFSGASMPWYAFLLKILFTALTLGAGFKGGEIVPSFFTGAVLGCFLGPVVNLPAPLCAACGMAGVFCGVTNCPITSLLIAFELFGFQAMPYFVITVAVCYMVSGYYGLYSSQKIVYSKYQTKFINRKTH